MIRAYPLEYRTGFLAEQRNKGHLRYPEGAAQAKIQLCAKNGLEKQTCFALEKHGGKI